MCKYDIIIIAFYPYLKIPKDKHFLGVNFHRRVQQRQEFPSLSLFNSKLDGGHNISSQLTRIGVKHLSNPLHYDNRTMIFSGFSGKSVWLYSQLRRCRSVRKSYQDLLDQLWDIGQSGSALSTINNGGNRYYYSYTSTQWRRPKFLSSDKSEIVVLSSVVEQS